MSNGGADGNSEDSSLRNFITKSSIVMGQLLLCARFSPTRPEPWRCSSPLTSNTSGGGSRTCSPAELLVHMLDACENPQKKNHLFLYHILLAERQGIKQNFNHLRGLGTQIIPVPCFRAPDVLVEVCGSAGTFPSIIELLLNK